MVIRGVLIRHGARKKRDREKQLTILLNKMHVMESQHKQMPFTGEQTIVPSTTNNGPPALQG